MNLADIVSGMVSGWAQVLIGQPLDFIKVKIQTARGTGTINSLLIAKNTYALQGIRGFYRGSSSLFLGFSGTIAAEFVIYEWVKRQLYGRREIRKDNYSPDKAHLWQAGVAGSAAGWILASIYCPIEYAKIQRQVSTSIGESSIGLLLRELTTNGIRNVYRGFWMTTMREVYGNFFYYFTYEGMVRTCTNNKREKADGKVFAASGAGAGIVYHLVTYPADTIKTNMQVGLSWKEAVSNSLTLSKLAGYKAALPRAIIVNAGGFWVYELTQRWMLSRQSYI